MKKIFLDTSYLVALTNQKDEFNEKAIEISKSLKAYKFYISEMVFDEYLAHFSSKGQFFRNLAVKRVESIYQDTNINVIPQTSKLFKDALIIYKSRSDSGFSLTDCASFKIMQEEDIFEAFTTDHHFEQAGFSILLK